MWYTCPSPAPSVPEAIEECGRRGVKVVILNGGGFAEAGPGGAAIEAECIRNAKQHGIRIFGPNCQGIINTDPETRAYCNFTFTKPEAGVVSIVALSGGVAELLHQTFFEMGIGTRMYASNGNACDVSIPEIIRYYGNDEGTKVIVLYVEGLRDPKAFLEAAGEVVPKKPILAMKAGRTMEGAKAAASHTGGLARKDITTDLIFEKAGVLNFRDEQGLCQAAAVLGSQPVPKGNRVGVISNTGGPSVIAADALIEGGLEIPALSDKTVDSLRGRLLPEVSIRNPLDVLATAGAGHFRIAMETMMADDRIDSIFINFVTPFFVDNESIAREIAAMNGRRMKPLVCNLMTERKEFAGTIRILREGGVPFYSFPGAAARALAALSRYGQIRRKERGELESFANVNRQEADGIIEKARAAGRMTLEADEVYGILSAYGIPVAPWRVVNDADGAVQAAGALGFPVVVKIEAPSVAHKSDLSGVVLNLNDEEAVRKAAQEIGARLNAPERRFLVQKYLPGEREIIVGAKQEEDLGHVIMCGIGGIYVEVLKDVAFKLSPVTNREAQEMLSSLKAAPLLKGLRGEKGIDEKSITDILQRVSRMLGELPSIGEMDLNPVVAFSDSACVVDARMTLSATRID